jgi:hypothetical protein
MVEGGNEQKEKAIKVKRKEKRKQRTDEERKEEQNKVNKRNMRRKKVKHFFDMMCLYSRKYEVKYLMKFNNCRYCWQAIEN